MENFKIGVLREGKVPPDFRVPLTPKQCRFIKDSYPFVDVVVQPSSIRKFDNQSYVDAGIVLQEDLSDCDLIMGVKEVQINDLIPNKKFMFFSHTIKKQSYNRSLLKSIIDNKIQLIDYEVLKNRVGKRLIGFGRYAGIVGCYNGFRAFGLKHQLYILKKACECKDRAELNEELKKVVLPKNTKIVATGFGRVGFGAREILNLLPIVEVAPNEFSNSFDSPIFTHLEVNDYFAHVSGSEFDKRLFYEDSSQYKSVFNSFAKQADMYIACHFWSSKSPFILTQEDLATNERLKVVADISCDIAGPIACTIRPSSISNPVYGFDPVSKQEVDFMRKDAVAVMAVDNLPCELPMDASEDFGNDFISYVLPNFFNGDPDKTIERGSETNLNGELMPLFEYLNDYLSDN